MHVPFLYKHVFWLMWHMTILYASTTLSNKNMIFNKRWLWHVTAQKICSLVTPAKMHCLYFITSISVAHAKILSAKKGKTDIRPISWAQLWDKHWDILCVLKCTFFIICNYSDSLVEEILYLQCTSSTANRLRTKNVYSQCKISHYCHRYIQ